MTPFGMSHSSMKFYYIAILLAIASCRNKDSTASKTPGNIDTTIQVKHANTIYDSIIHFEKNPALYTDLDTIRIGDEYDTLVYSKKEFNEIIDLFPDLHDNIPLHPDIAYFKSGIYKNFIDENGAQQNVSFGSESGQDEFYVLYAYFLRKKVHYKEADDLRQKLLTGCRLIRSMFLSIEGFGTYYTHMYSRIKGIVEYWIYWQGESITDPYDLGKAININAQRELFIGSLKKELSDAIQADNNIASPTEKSEKRTKVFALIEELNSLITAHFLLRCFQQYRYSYHSYY